MSSSSSKPTILITGASGTNGRDLARALTKFQDSVNVKLLVRDTEKSKDLAAFGTLVKGDLSESSTLASAFAGVDRLFLLVPFKDNAKELAAQAISAAKAAGVSFILKLSAHGADPKSSLWVSRDHGEQEDLVKASGINYTIIQPTFFLSNLLNYSRPTLTGQGAWYGASGGEGKYNPIDPADIAAVAATILASPSGHFGSTYLLTGDVPISDNELAALVSRLWGKTIKYVDVSPEQFKTTLLGYGYTENLAASQVGLQNMIKQGWTATPSKSVEDILKRRPTSPEAYFTQNKL